MSIYYSANLIYGVHLTKEEVFTAKSLPEWDDIYNKWGHTTDMIGQYSEDTIIIGICTDFADEGDIEEIGSIQEPRSEYIDALLEALDAIGIKRDPTWHLSCSVS